MTWKCSSAPHPLLPFYISLVHCTSSPQHAWVSHPVRGPFANQSAWKFNRCEKHESFMYDSSFSPRYCWNNRLIQHLRHNSRILSFVLDFFFLSPHYFACIHWADRAELTHCSKQPRAVIDLRCLFFRVEPVPQREVCFCSPLFLFSFSRRHHLSASILPLQPLFFQPANTDIPTSGL